tara:strand:+ start:480 stop:1070 length:591 start_codon:yes stop_codon:yes gene_type:complete
MMVRSSSIDNGRLEYTLSPKIKRIHHVAYRCKDAKETVEFYQDLLNMDFQLAIAENKVPSTKEPDPYMHVFLNAGNGSVLAFFELPNSPPMGKDPATPEWVQHIAFEVTSGDEQLEIKFKAETRGLEVLGPIDHQIFQSIYFFDPSGHRIEIATNTRTEKDLQRLNAVAEEMLEEWDRTKRAPRHAAWLHEKEFKN